MKFYKYINIFDKKVKYSYIIFTYNSKETKKTKHYTNDNKAPTFQKTGGKIYDNSILMKAISTIWVTKFNNQCTKNVKETYYSLAMFWYVMHEIIFMILP